MLAFIGPNDLTEPAKEASKNIIDQGVLGSLVILFAISLFFAVRGWIRAKDTHIKDKDSMMSLLQQQDVSSKALQHEITKAVEALKTTVDDCNEDIEKISNQMSKFGTEVKNLQTEQAKFIAVANAIRGVKS